MRFNHQVHYGEAFSAKRCFSPLGIAAILSFATFAFYDLLGGEDSYVGRLVVLQKKSKKAFKHRCYSLPDFSEFCLYENVCWGGNQLLIPFSDDDTWPSVPERRVVSDQLDEYIDGYMNLPNSGSSSAVEAGSALLPRRSFLNPHFSHVPLSGLNDAEWQVFGFLAGFDTTEANVFHFAESTLLYHGLTQMNASGFFPEPLPSLSIALLLQPFPGLSSWTTHFSTHLFGKDVRKLWSEDLGKINSSKPICFNKLAIPGTVIHLILGVRDAEALKHQFYSALSIVHPPRRRPPRLIVVESRDHRTWTNGEEILEVIQGTNVPYKAVSFATMTFDEQVEIMSNAGVFISAHGAGMTNILWMPTGAAVVEIFPSKAWHYNLYGKVARNAGLFHEYAQGNLSGASFGDAASTSMDCLNDSECALGLKQDFYLDPLQFGNALSRALNSAGIAIQ